MKKITAVWVCLMTLMVVSRFVGQEVKPPLAVQKAEEEREKRASEMRDRNREAVRSSQGYFPRTSAYSIQYPHESLSSLRSVNPEDLVKYKTFLADGKSGLFRLFPDFDCTTHFVLRVDGECANFVEASSGYSFRAINYRDNNLFNDINFNRDRITSRGSFLEWGAMTSLGKVPIDEVKLSDDAVRYLIDLKAPKKYIEICDLAWRIKNGIKEGSYLYTDSIVFEENVTYVIRLVAYKYLPVAKPAVQNDLWGYFDDEKKRSDLIVAFRGVGRDADGSITILWKELSRKKAPSISFGKYEKVGDFRPSRIGK